MFIRPYTISGGCVVLLCVFLIIYLQAAAMRGQHPQRASTRWMTQAIAWAAGIILLTMLAGVVEYAPLDALIYLRSACGLLFWHALARAVYALPPTEPFARREVAGFIWAIGLLVGLDLANTGWRLWRFTQAGALQARPALLNAPLLVLGAWVVLLMVRKLWAAEAAPGQPAGAHWRRVLLAPRSGVGGFYRWFLVATFGVIGMSLLFTAFLRSPLPTWLLVANDLLAAGAILIALFAYLSSPLAPTGLEIRVVGAGLTIFLGQVSLLGWIIALTLVRQQTPGIYPPQVFGSQMQAQFFVTPAAYRGLAQQLSDLLMPLLWFALLGSLLFMAAYSYYYRRTMKRTLGQIIGGFQQVQQGNLAYRIPVTTWEDEFSQIMTSFNAATAALEQNAHALQAYQGHLQTLVDQRTAELGREMELRKQLEVRQGIQDERTRIAQEAHDGLLQTLMGVRLRLNRGKRLSRMEAAAIEAELAELAGEIARSAQDLRALIHELNEEILPGGLGPALTQLIQRQQQLAPITIHARLDYPAGLLPLNRELDILRIVQEALTNAVRHGGATAAWVTVACDKPGGAACALHVAVRDNGQGFDAAQHTGTGWGLKNMQRRAAQLGGRLDLRSQPGAGAVVDLAVPLPRQEPRAAGQPQEPRSGRAQLSAHSTPAPG